MESKSTLAWRRYEAGRMYNNSLTPNQYSLVNTNVEFYSGNQWLHLPQTAAMGRIPKPTFNIIKRITQLFVATLTSTGTTIQFEPLTNDQFSATDGAPTGEMQSPDDNLAAFATDEVKNLIKKLKLDYRIREALFDGAQTGDYCAHFYWDPTARPYGGAFGPYRGEIKMEMVDGINVMFGNTAKPDVELQPYIILVGRDTVENLRREYKQYHKGAEESALSEIQPDSETQDQAGVGGKLELSNTDDSADKCLYLYMYTKKSHEEDVLDSAGHPVMEPILDKKGNPIQATDAEGKPIIDVKGNPVFKTRKMRETITTVHVTKATRGVDIYEDIDTGLDFYPIAWGNWEKQKNQYHGRALVTGIIPNQIFINTMFAMVMRHLQLQGFPKTVYNADLIGQWNNEIGQAVGVRGLQPNQPLSQVAYSLTPANMSDSIIRTIDQVMDYTKECLGATDVQMGNVKPDNTSALMVLQTSSEVPLENTRAGLYEWAENVGTILLDMMGTYYMQRPIIRSRTYEEPVIDPQTKLPKINEQNGLMEVKKVTHRVKEMFDFRQLKHLCLNVRTDVGASTYFSEIAMVQTLDNLRANGTLEIIDYLERIPDKLIPRKAELIESLKTRAGLQAEALMAQNEQANAGAAAGAAAAARMMTTGKKPAPTTGGELDTDKAVQSLPTSTQSKFDTLPTRSKNALRSLASMKV